MYYIFNVNGDCICSCTNKPSKSDLDSRQEKVIESNDFYDIAKIKAVGGQIQFIEQTLDELKAAKITELKAERDTKEVEPIEYNGHLYDYDDKARDRINAAIIALELAGAEASLEWTCADNTDATVTAADIKNIVSAVAVRSNALHVAYRNAKTAVEAATTKEELDVIKLN